MVRNIQHNRSGSAPLPEIGGVAESLGDIDYRTQAGAHTPASLLEAVAVDRLDLTGRFGVELEMEHMPLARMREVVAAYLGPDARMVDGGVLDADGRLWEVKPDLFEITELATPPLRGPNDLRHLQEIAARLTRAGAKPTRETGLHVHVDAKGLSEKQIVRLLGLVSRYETQLMQALRVHEDRYFYCGPVRRKALAPMLSNVPTSRAALMHAYRGPSHVKCLGVNVEHLAPSQFGTLEFRYFNGTLNPCIIGCHVGLALAMVRFARRDGPMPGVEHIADGGPLAGLLRALNLQPQAPSSILLYRSLMGMSMPQLPEPQPVHPKPSRQDIRKFTDRGVERDSAIDTLATISPWQRSRLDLSVETYLAVVQQNRLDPREMLALSRLDPETIGQVCRMHGAAIAKFNRAWDRADAITWFAAHSDKFALIQEAFGRLPLPYMIVAPSSKTLPLVERMNNAGMPLQPEALSVIAFRRLAHMDSERLAVHLDLWQAMTNRLEDPKDRSGVPGYILACLEGVPTADARAVLQLLEKHRVPLQLQWVTPRAFRGLSALPNAEAYLQSWLGRGPTFKPVNRWEETKALEELIDGPLEFAPPN